MNRLIEALRNNHISFRQIPSRKGTVLFCEWREKVTFDIERRPCGRIRAWSYIAEGIPSKKVPARWEFRAGNEEEVCIGLEEVEDGILSLYFEQNMPGKDQGEKALMQTASLAMRLDGYLEFMTGLKSILKREGLRVINEPPFRPFSGSRPCREAAGERESISEDKNRCPDETFAALSEKLDQVFGSCLKDGTEI